MKTKEQKIEQEFTDLVNALSEDEYWEFIREVFDRPMLKDIMDDWDIELKTRALTDLDYLKQKEVKKKVMIDTLKRDIKDLQNKLVNNLQKTYSIEQKKKIRDMRANLKDKITSYKLILEAKDCLK